MKVKFRAWQENHMIYQKSTGVQSVLEFFKKLYYDLDEKCIMQFTGLLDKKGNEISEGDVIEIDNGPFPIITKCIFDTGQFSLVDNAEGNWTRQLYHQPERLLIIGNQFENPELLK